MQERSIPPDELASWCGRWLGAEPRRVLFEVAHLSSVIGLELADGREVVVKVRPPAERISACVQVQRHLWLAGFPCPEPLAGPTPIGARTATAERLVPGGAQLEPGPDSPRRFAQALAEMVRLAPPVDSLPTLEPPPPWVWWDHDRHGIWPPADDRDADLNEHHEPAWLEEVGLRARRRLARCRQSPIVGHCDWESQNLRWLGRRLHVVHDWDSVVSQPEAMIAGTAAAVFPTAGAPSVATLDETEAFLVAYEQARGQPWSEDERQICWAAGLWISAFNAKKESVDSERGPVLDRLAADAFERLRLAGA